MCLIVSIVKHGSVVCCDVVVMVAQRHLKTIHPHAFQFEMLTMNAAMLVEDQYRLNLTIQWFHSTHHVSKLCCWHAVYLRGVIHVVFSNLVVVVVVAYFFQIVFDFVVFVEFAMDDDEDDDEAVLIVVVKNKKKK